MHWYSKYLSVYEKPLAETSPQTIELIRANIARINSSAPFVTVSVIGYNEERHLLACLWSLSEQQSKYPIEIIGVDNNSKDRTAEVFEAVGVVCHRETKQGCGHARQCGLDHARGRYHINIDADTMYPPHYVETMVESMVKNKWVAVSSLWSYIPDKQHSAVGLWFYETARDLYLWMQSHKRPELSVRGLVFAYEVEIARKIGIRTDIIRGEDGSLALELKRYGKIGFIHKRRARAMTGYGTVSQDGSFLSSFRVRVVKGFCNILGGGLFSSKSKYADEETNLLKKKQN